jgi:hypothetical protein
MKSQSFILSVALCGFIFTSGLGHAADTIYHSDTILTMAGKDPSYVEALAVKDGKILFAGANIIDVIAHPFILDVDKVLAGQPLEDGTRKRIRQDHGLRGWIPCPLR